MYAKHGNVVDVDASDAKAFNHVYRSFKVMHFRITETPTRDNVLVCNKLIIWSLESEMSKERSENIRFLEPHCHSAPLSIGNPANIRYTLETTLIHLHFRR